MSGTITDIESQKEFIDLLTNNKGVIVVKLGAEWCGPCKLIENEVHDFFDNAPANMTTVNLDVDESFDIYANLKRKKIVTAIPALLCYKKNNRDIIPDDVLIGTDKEQLKQFFDRCLASI